MKSKNRVRQARRTCDLALFLHESRQWLTQGSAYYQNWLWDHCAQKWQSLGAYHRPDQKRSSLARLRWNQRIPGELHRRRQRYHICDVRRRWHLHALCERSHDRRSRCQLQNPGKTQSWNSTVCFPLVLATTSLGHTAGATTCRVLCLPRFKD